MTISQLENAFQKTIHPDLKNKLFISLLKIVAIDTRNRHPTFLSKD